MKFAAIIEYGDDRNGLKANHAAHRTYLRTFLENGQLRAAGPFADNAGALWVLDADTAEAAEAIVKGDPPRPRGCATRPSWCRADRRTISSSRSGRSPGRGRCRRAFDPWLKKLLQNPRVAYALFRAVPVDVVTIAAYYPEQELYFPDYVGVLNDKSLLHIELESDPGLDMRQRLLDYGTRIIAKHGDNTKFRQHVLYNGDRALAFPRQARKFEHGSITHEYHISDFGSIISPDVLRRRDLDIAKLAVLMREPADLRATVGVIIGKARRQLGDKRLIDLTAQLVKLASLRRRGLGVVETILETDPMLAREMAEDPYMQSLKVDGRREALLDQMAELPFGVPATFIEYVRQEAAMGELLRIGRSLVQSPATFNDLLGEAGPLNGFEIPPVPVKGM